MAEMNESKTKGESPSEAVRTESLQELFDSRGVDVATDRDAGVVRGVKLLGTRSRNGRIYTEEALRSAVGLYEGAKVNVNHPAGDPLAPRDYRDRIGVVRNIRLRSGEGLFGDLHCNPKHPLAEQLIWDAEHAPENVGLSHNVVARTRRDATGLVVDAIKRVQSVDLVADPATTDGLFEHRTEQGDSGAVNDPVPPAIDSESASLRAVVERVERVLLGVRRLVLIESQLDRWGLRGASGGLRQATEWFAELQAAADDAEVCRLIEDRARRTPGLDGRRESPAAPQSKERLAVDAVRRDGTTKGFVEAISRR